MPWPMASGRRSRAGTRMATEHLLWDTRRGVHVGARINPMTHRDIHAEARATAEQLRRVLAAIDAEELTATATERAYIAGAVAALDTLTAE